jgi:membrane-bound lytic murein transglycosylase D
MRTTRLAVGFMMAALLPACAKLLPPPEASHPMSAPNAPLQAANLPPFDGERVEVKEPLRGIHKVDLAVRPDDLWQRIREGFRMPELDNALVRRRTREYAAGHPDLQRIFERGKIYLYHIVEEIENRGLPTELALLPIVESGYNPMARSPAQASGLWQFVPGTGKMFDLRQNGYYDGRRDIVDSTEAALDYLTKLYNRYRDWHLALASYNWGEHAVARAVANNRKAGRRTDYWSLRMPRETRNYVPKLQALKNIINEPAKYGIELTPIPNERYFTTVLTGRRELDVALAARLAEMPVNEFKALNPGLSRPKIRPFKATRIVLPSDKVAVFHENLARLDSGASAGGTRALAPRVHQVVEGNTLSGIAARYGLRLSDLLQWNPGGDLIRIGQTIYLEAR